MILDYIGQNIKFTDKTPLIFRKDANYKSSMQVNLIKIVTVINKK